MKNNNNKKQLVRNIKLNNYGALLLASTTVTLLYSGMTNFNKYHLIGGGVASIVGGIFSNNSLDNNQKLNELENKKYKTLSLKR